MQLRGSGSLALGQADAKHLTIDVRGSGGVRIAGKTTRLDVSGRGSGEVDARASSAPRKTPWRPTARRERSSVPPVVQ